MKDSEMAALEILSDPEKMKAIERLRGRVNKKNWKTTAQIRKSLGIGK